MNSAAQPSSDPGTRNSPFERRSVLSAAVDLASPRQFIEHLIACAESRTGQSVVGISAPYASAMASDAGLRDAFLKADVLIPDGKGFVWGARTLGVPCGERIAIPDLCDRLLEAGDARHWKVFIYGATAELNATAVANVKAKYPHLASVEGQHGYDQGEAEENAVIAKLRDEAFHVLIVARPSPDKEKFLAKCCHAAGVVGLAAGGYADILAGEKKRAPEWVQSAGMEWFYRLIQDPAKLWKRIGWANAKFALAVMWTAFMAAFLGRPRRAWFAQPWLQVPLLVAIVALAYAKSLPAPYHFDDPEYIQRNTAIRSLSTVNQITVTAHRKVWWYSNAICYAISEKLGRDKNTTVNFTPFNLLDASYYWLVKKFDCIHKTGYPDVRVFRLWNIACHAIAVLALFGLLRRCLQAVKKSVGAACDLDMRPFAASAIFAAHPLCTEAVTYISGRDNGMAGMFYLLGLYCAAIAFQRMGFGSTPRLERRPWLLLALTIALLACAVFAWNPIYLPLAALFGILAFCSNDWPAWFWPSMFALGCGACAILTKESHLTYPVAVGLLYVCFYRNSPAAPKLAVGVLCGLVPALAVLAWGAAGRYEGGLWIAGPLALAALAAGALLGGTEASARSGVAAFLHRRVGAGWAFLIVAAGLGAAAVLAFPYAYSRTLGALTGYQGSSYVRSLCTQANAVPWMLLRAVMPVGITWSPDFNIAHTLNIDHQFPTISDPGDPRTLIGGTCILLLVAFGIIGAFRGTLAGFGVLLALLVIAPTNTVIEKGDVVSERNFYLVAAGGACVLASLIAAVSGAFVRFMESASVKSEDPRIRSRLTLEIGLWTLLFALCFTGPFVAFTTLRNNDWGDPYRLWKSARESSPDKMRVLYNFGVSAIAANKIDEAETAFTRAIAIGEELSKRGAFRPDEAVDVKCFHLAYARLAEISATRYIHSNKEDYKALEAIKKIYEDGLNRTAWDPDLATTYFDFMLRLGRASDAKQMVQQSLFLHTWADQLYLPLGVTDLEGGNALPAVQSLEQALRLKDDHTLGFSNDMNAEYRAQVYSFLGVAHAFLEREHAAKANDTIGMNVRLRELEKAAQKDEALKAKESFREVLRLNPESALPILIGYNSTRNLQLPPQQTTDGILNAISQVRREILVGLRDAANELLAAPSKDLPSNLGKYKELVDDELNRRDAYQKRRVEMGFKDDPDRDY